MAYADESKVKALMAQFTFSGTSKPTSAQLTIIIEDVAGVMDTALAAQGVTVPVVAPAYFLDFLEGCNADGAAAQAMRSGFPDTRGPGEQPAFAFWQARFDKCMAGILDGTMIPAEATKGALVAPSTYFTRNPDTEEETGDIAEPIFKRDKIF